MIYHEAVTQAKYAFDHKAALTPQGRLDSALALHEWGIFSNRQISTFTGMKQEKVAGVTGKTDGTGGKLRGEALGPILKMMQSQARGEADYALTAAALQAGVSANMLARLTGQPQTTISRHARKAAEVA